MSVNYGIDVNPPDIGIAQAFGANEEPILLEGGKGNSYLSGNIVLKPVEGVAISNWVSEIFSNLKEAPGVRYAKPIRSIHGHWIYKDYTARYFLRGEHVRGQYEEKLHASRELHKLLKNIPKPDFIETPQNSWFVAHMVALDDLPFDYEKEFMDLYEQIKPHLEPLHLENQLVHADLGGNFLCDSGRPPAIIDFSPAWAPNGFGEGIMLADVVTWEDATKQELEVFKQIPNIKQLAWRGVLSRVTEQAEHIKWFGKDEAISIETAQKYQKAIDFLNTDFF